MNDQHTFDTILDECIDAVLYDGASIDDCLARYPQHADSLKPELQVALLTTRLKSPVLPEARVDALEARLRAQMPAPRAKIIAFPPLLSRMAAVLALVLVIAFAGGGGVVAASSDSVPGDTLYPVKRSWEQIIVLIASITGNLDDVWLQLADTRLDEAKIITARGEITPDLLDDLREATANAMQYADATPELQAYLDELAASLETGEVVPPDAETTQAILDLIAPESVIPPGDAQVETPATNTPALTVTPTQTVTLTQTASPTPTEIVPQVVDATNTATPLFPATPTRTLTPTVTLTTTPSPTITPTQTFTPLPPPTQRPLVTAPVGTPVGTLAVTPPPGFGVTPDPNGTWYPYPQLTQDIFYITRTAEAEATRNARGE